MRSLPFGETQITVSEAKSLMNIGAAIDLSQQGDVEHPEERINEFVESVPGLLQWLENHGRRYPWRNSHDPYEVFIAEILLQRTRGDAVNKIYRDFLESFPDLEALNEAEDTKIRSLIRSLGFVNHRTRTLNEIGEIFTEQYDSKVPDSVEELQQPWRVGEYSARACQIFARDEPMALVDSNFARVFSRVLGYEMPNQPHKSSAVYALLDALIPSDPDVARAFNLAVLDLGALVCTPSNPACESCPLRSACNFYEREMKE